MERMLDKKEWSYNGLFQHVGRKNKLHVSLEFYSASMIRKTCSYQNRICGCDPMNNKFATTEKEKVGYITIIQRY